MTVRRDKWLWEQAQAFARNSGVPVPKHVKVDIDWGDQADPPWTEEEKADMIRRFNGDYSAWEDDDGNNLPGKDYSGYQAMKARRAKGE